MRWEPGPRDLAKHLETRGPKLLTSSPSSPGARGVLLMWAFFQDMLEMTCCLEAYRKIQHEQSSCNGSRCGDILKVAVNDHRNKREFVHLRSLLQKFRHAHSI